MEITFVLTALFVSFLWGLQPVILKHALGSVDFRAVFVITALVYAVCVAIFSLFNWSALRESFSKIDCKSTMLIALSSLLTAFFANILFMYLLRKRSSSVVTAIVYSSPVFTLILAYLFLNEHLGVSGCIGVLLIVVGMVCIAMNEHQRIS